MQSVLQKVVNNILCGGINLMIQVSIFYELNCHVKRLTITIENIGTL